MSAGKASPRQKMINMMYLVLTALLALNVSKDILNAFVIVNDGLLKSQVNFINKNDKTYQKFTSAMIENKSKVQKWNDKAFAVKKMSLELQNYIKELRSEIIAHTDQKPKEVADTISLMYVDAKDNFDKPMEILIGQKEDGSGGKARELKTRLEKFKKEVVEVLPDNMRSSIIVNINTEAAYSITEGKVVEWELHNFFHTVLAADVAILNKIIIDVQSAESDVIAKLLEAITAEDFKFDQIAAKIIPKSNYVLVGDKYEADIFVAAYSTTQQPTVLIGSAGDTVKNEVIGQTDKIVGQNGLVKYSAPAGAEGERKFGGVIQIVAPGGKVKNYAFNSAYTVARPSAVVSAEKMNVFYIGLDNPVSVSVPGVPAEKVSVSMAGGTIVSAGKGKYNVRVGAPGEATINVIADLGGTRKPMGSFKYRIKKIPDPKGKVCGKTGGVVPKGQLIGAPFVIAELEDFLFEGVRYTVVGYKFSTVEGGFIKEYVINGSKLDASSIATIRKAKSNQKVFFEEIKAKGPAGDIRTLPSVILKLN